jgi:Leucine-rich repeat (LRR) protein
MAEQENSEAPSEANRRIEQARARSASHVLLIALGLEELPESLWHLEHLQSLYLSSNQISSLAESIGQLTALEMFCFSRNVTNRLLE